MLKAVGYKRHDLIDAALVELVLSQDLSSLQCCRVKSQKGNRSSSRWMLDKIYYVSQGVKVSMGIVVEDNVT